MGQKARSRAKRGTTQAVVEQLALENTGNSDSVWMKKKISGGFGDRCV